MPKRSRSSHASLSCLVYSRGHGDLEEYHLRRIRRTLAEVSQLTSSDGRGSEPRFRSIARSIRKAPLGTLREWALSGAQDQQSRDANEWYWVQRFGHPLVDHISIQGLITLSSVYMKKLSEEEISSLTSNDLAVLAHSESPVARMIAAEHRAAPVESLERLARDSDPAVRTAVGHNPVTPAEVIHHMRSRSRSDQDASEIDRWRLELLWTELDHIPIDQEVALGIAVGYADFGDRADALRLALARRKHLPPDIAIALAGSRKISAEVASILAVDKDQRVRAALAVNRQAPVDVLLKLLADAQPTVRVAAASNPCVPEQARADLLMDKDREVRRGAVVNGWFSDEAILGLDSDSDSRQSLQERLALGSWAESAHVLRELARSPHPGTRAAVARHPNTPVETLLLLAIDEDDFVTRAVEEALSEDSVNSLYSDGYQLTPIWWYRRELDSAELLALAKSPNSRVRSAVAGRLVVNSRSLQENIDQMSTLRALAKDREPTVRGAAARNPRIHFEELLRLADDPNDQVQRCAAGAVAVWLQDLQSPTRPHENWLKGLKDIPASVPRQYGGHPDWDRLKIGAPRLGDVGMPSDAVQRLAGVMNPAVRTSVASYSGSYRSKIDPNALADVSPLSPGSLLILLRDPEASVRTAAFTNTGTAAVLVAASPGGPDEVLIGYARSSSASVRHAVAANTGAPSALLANLARDSVAAVRAAVAANLATPAEALGVLAADLSEEVLLALIANENAPQQFLEQQAHRNSDHERQSRLARNPRSPELVLRKLAYSQWVDVRAAVAGNPSTPAETLEILSLDENSAVRETAKRRM